MVDKTGKKTSPPPMETDSHSGEGKAPFVGKGSKGTKGETPGNKALPTDLSHDGGTGTDPESHSEGHKSSPFLGDTKGNKDLPIDRSQGTGGGAGGRYIASNDRFHGGRKQSPEGN